mmetsp:Transcript_4706/g.14215  ORF Transcript_4706/g.14215 Transcript_4706/m.14215 type:complete len:206 (-) Transcript_4706:113-730(-)
MTKEALRASVDEWNDGFGIHVSVCGLPRKRHNHVVDPPSGKGRVESRDDEVERSVESLGHLLDGLEVRLHLHSAHSPHDKFGRDDRFGSADILWSKEELPVEVGHVNRVHVDDVQVPEAGQGQHFQKLAPKAPSANDEHPAVLTQELQQLRAGLEVVTCERSSMLQDGLDVGPASTFVCSHGFWPRAFRRFPSSPVSSPLCLCKL